MAYLIECDRCGETEKVANTSEIPARWLQFNQLWRGHGDTATKPIDGGVFCASCASDLEKWRKPIPRCMPMDPEQFKRSA